MNQQASQRSKVILGYLVQVTVWTHRHTKLTVLPGPLKWLVKVTAVSENVLNTTLVSTCNLPATCKWGNAFYCLYKCKILMPNISAKLDNNCIRLLNWAVLHQFTHKTKMTGWQHICIIGLWHANASFLNQSNITGIMESIMSGYRHLLTKVGPNV